MPRGAACLLASGLGAPAWSHAGSSWRALRAVVPLGPRSEALGGAGHGPAWAGMGRGSSGKKALRLRQVVLVAAPRPTPHVSATVKSTETPARPARPYLDCLEGGEGLDLIALSRSQSHLFFTEKKTSPISRPSLPLASSTGVGRRGLGPGGSVSWLTVGLST